MFLRAALLPEENAKHLSRRSRCLSAADHRGRAADIRSVYGINFNKAEFILSAVRQSAFIRDGRPQVAFAGRSNVGKSSAINRLLNRKNFARVGATREKPTQVNYFLIDSRIYFTDLPHGYAKVSKEERDRWGR